MTENNFKKPNIINDEDDGGEGENDFQWQRRLYAAYEMIHEQHQGEKAPVMGFDKDKNPGQFNDPLTRQDMHPISESPYFQPDYTMDTSVPQDSTQPNVRNELRKNHEKRLQNSLSSAPKLTPFG